MRAICPRSLLGVAFLLLLFVNPAHGHKPSDSYLSLKVEGDALVGQWDIALRDLEFAIGIDANNDGEIIWDEVRAKHQDIAVYALSHLKISSKERACPIEVSAQKLNQHADGTYTALFFKVLCANVSKIDSLGLQYSLLFDVDPQHKGLLKLTSAAGKSTTAIFSPDRPDLDLVIALANASAWEQFADYFKHGVWHIWIGFDHILFLLSLLIPAVLMLTKRVWLPMESFKMVVLEVLKIVTAFTLAHSITLSLAALQLISLPTRWVESVIAFSVVLAALNNLFPFFHARRWLLAFGFGLIHGFGFANVLSDLGLAERSLGLALIGFNLGVESGQLVIVAFFLPVAYWLRSKRTYQTVVLQAGSVGIALLAAIWFVERAFEVRIF
jgi:hypothetical protein